jgi:hypothetical protein
MLLLFEEVIAVYSENYSKRISTLCEQSLELVNVKADGTLL